jgi:hypothetical protein
MQSELTPRREAPETTFANQSCLRRNRFRTALLKCTEHRGKSFWPEVSVARTKYHLSQVLTDKAGTTETPEGEAMTLAQEGKDVLSRLLVYDPSIPTVKEEHTGALFDHLQPVFGGRFTGQSLLEYMT